MTLRLDLAEVIAERTLHLHDKKKLEQAIAAYLLEHNDAYELDSLIRDVLVYRAAHGYVEATIISAYPLATQVHSDVLAVIKTEYPDAKSIVLNQKIDPSVVGGLRIEMAGEELDLTVQAKLNKFKRLTLSRKD
ncbi:hypothetical protein BH10PAT3_BH10PAT3_2100 [soil metagenome]